MDKKRTAQIKRALRQLWMISPERTSTLKDAKERIAIGHWKNGNKRFKVMYRCSDCNRLVAKDDVQVDHSKSVEPSKDWNEYMQKLFCGMDNLSCLCIECHRYKTASES